MNRTGGMFLQPLPIAIAVAFLLVVAFLYAVREGRFASPGARTVALAVILMIAILVWLVPSLVRAR
jgi:hypothetical protein